MRVLAVVLALSAIPMASRADEISGDWCSDGGAQVRIDGDKIRTPGGQQTQGVYSRHRIDFVIPEGEPDAGLSVAMRQLSEERVIVTYDGGEPEEWHRCKLVS
ncbi:hypothetical protein [Marimonas arenosa]|uniref:Uncharacterized protein n=1 Tax=Marimonas arenosa TaxID=1795305 RepID=A0AAE4B3G7_9RHOB|nr:hypothetical protein [Marimonas arenosa]MDQ2088354.1 hypothetical protein [Marimonas arenosa]